MKKNNYKIYIGLLIILLLQSGCQKAPINNLIEGMWKLEEYTTHEDNVTRNHPKLAY